MTFYLASKKNKNLIKKADESLQKEFDILKIIQNIKGVQHVLKQLSESDLSSSNSELSNQDAGDSNVKKTLDIKEMTYKPSPPPNETL